MKKFVAVLLTAFIVVLIFASVPATASALSVIGRLRIEDYVNVRSSPDTSSNANVIFQTSSYIEADYYGLEGKWYHICTDDGIEGYVYSDYATVISTDTPSNPPEEEIEPPVYNNYVMIDADSVNYRTGPGTNYGAIGEIWSCRVPSLGKVVGDDKNYWYKIVSPGGKEGYVREDFIKEYTYKTDPQFEKTLTQFPESYKDGLRYLHTFHPEWKFTADFLPITLSYAVSQEAGRKIISDGWTSLPESWRTSSGIATLEAGNRYASATALTYVMNPENFIAPYSIFMFMEQSFDASAHKKEGLKKIVEGTYLDRSDYIDYLMEAAEKSGVNPYVLAGTIIHEQGKDGSELSLGKYPGYEGYYNFFNFAASGASTEAIIKNGLEYAKKNGWNTAEKAIVGGAIEYGENYVNTGQYTYYLKDYNVVMQHWSWQYATGLFDHINNAATIAKEYGEIVSSISFRIPVYKDAHFHSFSDWKTDEEYHWKECSCKEKSDYAKHNFSNVEVTVKNSLFSDGTKKLTCSDCGYVKYEVIPSVLKFNESEDGITITGYNSELPENLTIARAFNGKPIISIGENAFKGADTLKEITIKSPDLVIEKSAVNSSVSIICYGGKAEEYAKNNGNKYTVLTVMIGDLNDDGKVSDADAVYLLMSTFFSDDYPIYQDCDFNGDGKVSDADAVYLLMYTFFPDDYPI